MKILIIRFSSIGDIAQTSPVLRCVRKKYPNAELHFLTKKQFGCMMKHNPNITKLWLLEDSLLEVIRKLKSEKFDVLIDLHHNLRTFLIKALLGVKSHSFPKLNFEKWLLINFGINLLPSNLHLVDRYFLPLKYIDVVNDGLGLDYFLGKEDRVDVKSDLPDGYSDGYVAWVVGAKYFTKILPSQKVIEAIKLILLNAPDERFVLIGGEDDAERGNEIISAVGTKNVFNACGKFSLNQSVSLISQSKIVVGNDTGLTQIAPAFGKSVVSVWGSTSIVFGVEPYFTSCKKQSTVIEVKQLSCRPCSKFGRSACPKGHLKCLNQIDVKAISDALLVNLKD